MSVPHIPPETVALFFDSHSHHSTSSMETSSSPLNMGQPASSPRNSSGGPLSQLSAPMQLSNEDRESNETNDTKKATNEPNATKETKDEKGPKDSKSKRRHEHPQKRRVKAISDTEETDGSMDERVNEVATPTRGNGGDVSFHCPGCGLNSKWRVNAKGVQLVSTLLFSSPSTLVPFPTVQKERATEPETHRPSTTSPSKKRKQPVDEEKDEEVVDDEVVESKKKRPKRTGERSYRTWPIDFKKYSARLTDVVGKWTTEEKNQMRGKLITDFKMAEKLASLTADELQFVQREQYNKAELKRLHDLGKKVAIEMKWAGLFLKWWLCAHHGICLGRFIDESRKQGGDYLDTNTADDRKKRTNNQVMFIGQVWPQGVSNKVALTSLRLLKCDREDPNKEKEEGKGDKTDEKKNENDVKGAEPNEPDEPPSSSPPSVPSVPSTPPKRSLPNRKSVGGRPSPNRKEMGSLTGVGPSSDKNEKAEKTEKSVVEKNGKIPPPPITKNPTTATTTSSTTSITSSSNIGRRTTSVGSVGLVEEVYKASSKKANELFTHGSNHPEAEEDDDRQMDDAN